MIITRTPFPVSLAGGGTDVPSFYRANEGGAVTSLALDRFVHVLVSERADPSIRVAYSRTENVAGVDDLQHRHVREALRLAQVHRAVEVHTITDLPGDEAPLGASSSLAVGLLHALYGYRKQPVEPSRLAEEACRIEINLLHEISGKQDPYTSAFGGVHYFEFRPDDTVRVHPIPLGPNELDALSAHLSLFYAGASSPAQPEPSEGAASTTARRDTLIRRRDLAGAMRDALMARDWDRAGAILGEERQLDSGPANEWYSRALEAGALGAQSTGPAGGEFLLLFHPPERSAQVARALSRLERMPIRISPEGSRILVVPA